MRIAVFTDTHLRAPEGDTSSPYAVNERANARARYATALIAELAPDHTVHLGDMVHPLPHMAAYASAAAEAKRVFEPLQPQLSFVPGNHDIGDKPSPGLPAKATNPDHISRYESAFGDSAWASVCGEVTLVAINSSLINTGLEAEHLQFDWLAHTLSEHRRQQVLLFSHYPPFIQAPDEPDHYDNIAEPGRSRLLKLASSHGVRAILSGHVHHFFYNRYGDMQLWCLPATSFTRQDYSELFQGKPAPEHGRDDTGKYGVALFDVDEETLDFRWFQTHGRTLAAHERKVSPSTPPRWTGLVPHMRHDWHSARQLPYNGPMEEYSRKSARNDYPLLRLLQSGIDTVRVPLSDLLTETSRTRLLDWASLGVRFVVFSTTVPDEDSVVCLNAHARALAGFELIDIRGTLDEAIATAAEIVQRTTVPVTLAKASTSAATADGKAFAHTATTGYPLSDCADIVAALARSDEPCPGVLLQLAWEEPVDALTEAVSRIQGAGSRVAVNVRLSHSNPADANTDDVAIDRKLRAALAFATDHDVVVQCDTFEDVDRGYHPRHGLVDRLHNFRHAHDTD